VSAKRKTTHNHAVVMEQNAAMRENIKSTKAQTLIPEGTVLKIESEDANWAQVKLPNGRNGWIEKSALARI
jgi:SH3-like domain-containing protein